MKNLLTNWKTTLAGFLGIVLFLLGVFDPKTFTPAVIASVITLLASFGLIVAKDGNVTGIGATATTIEQTALPIVAELTATSTNPTMEDVHKVIAALTTNPAIVINGAVTPVAPVAAPAATATAAP
jgi:hypothetical protein